jgi:hypothetical protein
MNISAGEFGVSISADLNVTKYASEDYMSADLTGYNPSDLNVKELRALYNEAQNVFCELRAKRVPLEECRAERDRLASQYAKYKQLFLVECASKQFKSNLPTNLLTDLFTI